MANALVCLDDFLDRFGTANPFTDNRSSGPATSDVDVPHIHQAAFQRLISLANEAGREKRSLGALLWGEAGIGKSHLLARLAAWANENQRATFLYLHNLQASPANLPRSLLKTVVSILTNGQVRQLHRTPLQQMLLFAAGVALRNQPGNHSWDKVARAFWLLVDRIAVESSHRALPVDRTVYQVLFQFFRSTCEARHGFEDGLAALALRWLSGEALDPLEARRIGLFPTRRDEPVALADNQQVKQVLVALTELARLREQPFILCFDQVDNLDPEQAGALARFLEALIDSSTNLLVVTAGIQATLLRWREDKVIQDSAWDRLAQFEVSLQRIDPDAARELLAARLQSFLAPFLELDAVRVRHEEDSLFPLGRAWAAEFFKDRIEVRPRDVLTAAREAWRRTQEQMCQLGGRAWLELSTPHPPAIPAMPRPSEAQVNEAIDRRITRQVLELEQQRHKEPATLPPDAANLAGLVGQLLEQWRQVEPRLGIKAIVRPENSRGAQAAYHLLLTQTAGDNGTEIRTGIRFLITSSATATTTELRRLVRDPEPPERVLLVHDERQPAPRAARGREYLQELHDRGPAYFREIVLTFVEYAHLDALQAVVGLARSGDLEIDEPGGETHPLSEAEVIAAHQRQQSYRRAAVLRELLNWAGRDAQGAAVSDQLAASDS